MDTSVRQYEATSILSRKILIIQVVVVSSKETVLEINAEKTKCMVMYRVQNTGNHYIKIGNKSLHKDR